MHACITLGQGCGRHDLIRPMLAPRAQHVQAASDMLPEQSVRVHTMLPHAALPALTPLQVLDLAIYRRTEVDWA